MPKLTRANRRRVWVYGTILTVLIGAYFYQPVRIDFLAKPLPSPNPSIDPDSKALFAKGARVMVVTAHPDDTEYYLAGLLMKLAKSGARIDLIVCTDGDKSFYPWGNSGETRRERRAEQLEAASAYRAAHVWFLAYPDGRLHPNADVVRAIRAHIESEKPEWLLTFDGDYPPKVSHGDHRSAGQAAFEAAKGAGAHWAMLFATRAPNCRFDISETEGQQRRLLAIHKSQFSGEKLERVAATVEEAAIEQGEPINATYGIELRCVRP